MRLKLPSTRSSVTRKIDLGQGWEIYLTVGFYDDRQPGEIFVKVAKHGSVVSGLMDGVAVLASMLLQNGIPMAEVARKLEHTRFDPWSDEYSSLLDAVAKNAVSIVRDGDGDPSRGHGYLCDGKDIGLSRAGALTSMDVANVVAGTVDPTTCDLEKLSAMLATRGVKISRLQGDQP